MSAPLVAQSPGLKQVANNGSILWLRDTNHPAAYNMAFDDAMLHLSLEMGHPLLRFYGWNEPAATFGYSQHIAEVETMTHLRPLIRRPTGGGVVPHDADWTYSVAFPRGSDWYDFKAEESYRRVHEWLKNAFAKMNIITALAPCCKKPVPGACFEGYEKFDLLWNGKKIAGAAQRRAKTALLIQGSVQPPPILLNRVEWENAMIETALSSTGLAVEAFQPNPLFIEETHKLAREVYATEQHNRRR